MPTQLLKIGHEWTITSHDVNTWRPRQNRRHFPDDIFKRISLNETVWISLKISLKFVPRVPINNIPALVQMMAWRWPGDKPLSEPMMVSSLTHICVTRPQWVIIIITWWWVLYSCRSSLLRQKSPCFDRKSPSGNSCCWTYPLNKIFRAKIAIELSVYKLSI